MQLPCPSCFRAQGDNDLFEFEAVLNCVTTGRSGVIGTNPIPQFAFAGGSNEGEQEAQEAWLAHGQDLFCRVITMCVDLA